MSGSPFPTHLFDDIPLPSSPVLWSNDDSKSFINELDENLSSSFFNGLEEDLSSSDDFGLLAPTNDIPPLVSTTRSLWSNDKLESFFDDLDESLYSLDNSLLPPTDDCCTDYLHLHDQSNNDNINTNEKNNVAPGVCESGLSLHDEHNNNNNNNNNNKSGDEDNNNNNNNTSGECGSGLRLHDKDDNNENNNNKSGDEDNNNTSGDCESGLRLHDKDDNNTSGDCGSGSRLHNEDNNHNNHSNTNNITSEIRSRDFVDSMEHQTLLSTTNEGKENYGSLIDIPQKKRNKRPKVKDCSWTSCTDALTLEIEKPKRKRKPKIVEPRKCNHCSTTETPQWRNGPWGKGSLCNACGVRYKMGKLLPEYRPASSPTFDKVVHSNYQKKIARMKPKGNLRPRKICIRPNQFQYCSVNGSTEQGCADPLLKQDSNAVAHQVHKHVGHPVNWNGNGSDSNQIMDNL